MAKTIELIGNLANALAQTKATIKAPTVAGLLNQNKLKNLRGKEYSTSTKSRGIFKVIRSAYNFFKNKGDETTAYNIANSIVSNANKYPWKKK